MNVIVLFIYLFASLLFSDRHNQIKDRRSVVSGSVYDDNRKHVTGAEGANGVILIELHGTTDKNKIKN